MKRLLSVLLYLYPSEWRARYGEELRAVLEDSSPKFSAAVDILKGGLIMRLTAPSFPRLAALLCCVGLAGGFMVSYLLPDQYESSALLRLKPSTSLQSLQIAEAKVMSRQSLAEMIFKQQGLNLYENERRRSPLEDIENEMRKNIRVLIHPDRRKAHDTMQAHCAVHQCRASRGGSRAAVSTHASRLPQ
ncbi:MAG TPA: hypothetical protein VFC21_09925 [Bryobacteraceae bacterium]|nr:hypothetical protein [Bryobacteraceae bacterium]